MTFPAGNYEALRVEIGSAKGHNWWGMLYPELAFWDAVHTVNEETKSERDGILLSEEEKKPEESKISLLPAGDISKIKQQKETKEKYDGIFSQTFCERL